MIALAGRVVTASGAGPGWVEIDGDRIAGVGAGAAPPTATGRDGWSIVPGFVDLHSHGGGGHSYTAGDHAAIAAGVAFHRQHGTTTTLLSLVTAPADELVAACASIAALLDDAEPGLRQRIAGIHSEGPFLSAARCGAQDAAAMSDPDPRLIEAMISAARGHLRVMTIAPERPGALEAIAQLRAGGVIVAVGHTDATSEQVSAAISAGATLATHLGNAMSPLHHREPGAVGACLAAPDVTCEVIVDGHHLHPEFVRLVAGCKGDDGMVLVTDAISAAGAGDGNYRLGRFDVVVAGGVATLAGGSSLAGSTLTMDHAFHNAVAAGLGEVAASRAASGNGARLLGLGGEIGAVDAGRRADLVVLDDESGGVVAVLAAGEVVEGSLDRL